MDGAAAACSAEEAHRPASAAARLPRSRRARPPRGPRSLARTHSSRGSILALATALVTGRSSRPSLRNREVVTGDVPSASAAPTTDAVRVPQWISSTAPTRASRPPGSIRGRSGGARAGDAGGATDGAVGRACADRYHCSDTNERDLM